MASTNKYDRQLRLWGRNGQKALVESKLLLLGASCTGSETLKNLVLPGCGCITIVDDAVVDEAEVSSNFFTRAQDIGRPLAEVVKELMCEMNPDTQSSEHVVQSPSAYIAAKKGEFSEFSLVIATQLPASTLRELGKACAASSVPLLVVRTYGLIGYVRVVLPRHHHPVVQDHTAAARDISDQWIQNPWDQLLQWRNTFDLSAQNSIDHMHTPWPVVLHHVLARYKEEFGEEKYQSLNRGVLEKYVLDVSMKHRLKLYNEKLAEYNQSGGGGSSSKSDEDEVDAAPEDPRTTLPPLNYIEAKKKCYKALNTAEIPFGLAQVLKDPRAVLPVGSGTTTPCTNPASTDKHLSFWVVMQSVNRFIAQEGRGYLPVTGTVVDLTASSAFYIAMQTQHQEKHQADVASVLAHVLAICAECGLVANNLSTTPFADSIKDMVVVVIKSIREISLQKTTSLEEEYTNTGTDSNGDAQPGTTLGEKFMMAPYDDANTEMLGALWYVMMRACDRFYIAHDNTYPGGNVHASEDELANDAKEVIEHAKAIQSDLGYAWDVGYDKAAMEMVRYGGMEVHTVAAYIGGIAGQEAVKILSHQYTPLNSTYVYNGIDGSGSSYLF